MHGTVLEWYVTISPTSFQSKQLIPSVLGRNNVRAFKLSNCHQDIVDSSFGQLSAWAIKWHFYGETLKTFFDSMSIKILTHFSNFAP